MTVKAILAASTALVTLAGTAQAADVAALIGNDTIAIVDTSAKKATKKMKVEGVTGPLVGIDVRPADGMLYALVADGTLYTIAMTARHEESKLETMRAAGARHGRRSTGSRPSSRRLVQATATEPRRVRRTA